MIIVNITIKIYIVQLFENDRSYYLAYKQCHRNVIHNVEIFVNVFNLIYHIVLNS